MPTPANPLDAIAAHFPDFDDEAEKMLTLRQQALADPLPSCPMNLAKRGEDEDLVEPGTWRVGFADRRTGLPVNCPVAPLGKAGDVFFFLNTLGEVHTLQANAGKGHIDALFAGRPRFLKWAWPQFSPKRTQGEAPHVKNWAAEEARQDLFAACAYKGTFELEDRVRGRGAWRDDDGSLIYHAGDAVWIGGQWRPPGEWGGYIYPGRPKIGRPSLKHEPEGDGSPGDVLLEGLRSWNWDRPQLDPRLALGWQVLSMVGGALAQRPIVYVVGTEGAGKSTLQALLRHVANGALVSTSNTTQAGIYQKVRQDSIAVMVDELEAKEDTRTTDKILELARIAYSGDKMQRGGKDGVGQEFAVMSSFLFSSIALPAMGAQDASRMAVLLMRERAKPQPGERPVEVLKELGLRDARKAKAIGAQLLKRMFRWFEMEGGRTRWEALREVFREMLIGVGHEDRSADTFGALAAGCHAALRDGMPDAVELAQWGEWLKADQLYETAGREKTWRRCLVQILDAQPEMFKTRHHKSVGSALADYEKNPQLLGDAESYCSSVGLALSFARDDVARDYRSVRLFVPAKHPALVELLRNTAWAGVQAAPGPWGGVLRQMPRGLWETGKCDKGLDKKASGIFIRLAEALEA